MPKQTGYFNDANYQKGYFGAVRFSATLQMTTPLRVLIHHGEIFHGNPGNAPDYAEQSTMPGDYSPYGIWIGCDPSGESGYKGFEGDGKLAQERVRRIMSYFRGRHIIREKYKPINQDDLDLYEKHYNRYFRVKSGEDLDMYSEHSSDIGPIAPIDYLPFLIDFRKIYESKDSIDQKCAKIFLLLEDPRFAEIKPRIQRSYRGEFPHRLFYSELLIPGIGWKTARHLYFNGIQSPEEMTDPAKIAELPDCGASRRALRAIEKHIEKSIK